MSKPYQLKKWLTLPEAAKHLSIVLSEEVTVADVLRMGLDKKLKLSVCFVNHVFARHRRIVPITEAKTFPSPDGQRLITKGIKLNDEEILAQAEGPVFPINGVWDLLMVGGEVLDIQHAYLSMTSGPSENRKNIDGRYLANSEGVIVELQSEYDEDGETSVRVIGRREKSVSPEKYYYPSGALPEDSILVIRTDALREFEAITNGTPADAEKPLATTERNTLLTIIAALCDYSAIDPQGRWAASQIAKLTEAVGSAVSDDTVRRALVKIPDALASRVK
jgi:hypothetical protein